MRAQSSPSSTQLSSVGALQVLTLTAGAILNQRVAATEFHPTSNGLKCIGGRGMLRLDFRHFGPARAVHLRRPTGHSFGLEFTDLAGLAAHAFMLTQASNFDGFFAWVRLHQACGASQPAFETSEESAAEPVRRHWEGGQKEEERSLDILMASIEHAVPIRATLFNGAVTHTAEFVPKTIERNADWTTVSNGSESLHFRHGALVGGERTPALGVFRREAPTWGIVEPDGALSLLLEPAERRTQRLWRALSRYAR